MLSNRTSRVYCDEYELDGLLAATRRRFESAPTHDEACYYAGVHQAVWLLKTVNMRDQQEFFLHLDVLDKDSIYGYEKELENA